MIGLIYKTETGLIEAELRGGDITPEATAQDLGYGAGYGLLYGASYTEGMYVLDGVLTARPALPYTLVGNVLTVPVGTQYSVQGPVFLEGVSADGVLEFVFAEPGTYTVTLRLFPYLDAEVTLVG